MGLIFNLLTLPILGGPRLVSWLADKTAGEARDQFLDERRVRGELLKLQHLYDAGEMEEEEYDRHEKALLEELNVIRELKAQLRDQG